MTDHQLLTAFATKLVEQLKAATPKATGKTAAAISFGLTTNGVQITAPDYFAALETGRGPSKGSGGSLYRGILEWVKARGIIPKEPKMTQQSLAYIITRKIHQEGSLLYRKGGLKNGPIAKVLGNVDYAPLLQQLSEKYTQQLTTEIMNAVINP